MVEGKSRPGDKAMRLTLLGTGGPPPVMERFGPGTLIEAGGEALLFDAGRGVLQRLFQIRPQLQGIREVFLTHLHSDHIVGLPDLWLTGWLNGRPERPLNLRGPRGTRAMMDHLDQAFQFDIRIRLFDDRTPPQGVTFLAEDIKEGEVFNKNGVKVTAFEVDHSPIWPAFGYRIDYAGHSVVISGDTRFSENLIRNARNVDVIVHEVIAADLMRSNATKGPEVMERVIAHHTTPEQAGEVFTRIQPRLAVFTHFIPVNAAAKDILPSTSKTYSGPLEMGEDLMAIDVGDEINVHRARK